MDVGTSKGLESFLAFLRETTERHRMAEADRAEAEAATQDLLHALELGDDKAPGPGAAGAQDPGSAAAAPDGEGHRGADPARGGLGRAEPHRHQGP